MMNVRRILSYGLLLSDDVIRYFIEELKIEPDFDCISARHHANRTIKYLVDKVKNQIQE